jgi:hypothetical protein
MQDRTATDIALAFRRIDIAEMLGEAERQLDCLRVGGNISVPEKILDVPPKIPEFPPNTRMAIPFFILSTIIDEHGHVGRVRILKTNQKPAGWRAEAVWFSLIESSIEAIEQWRYMPTTIDGEAVCIEMTITVHFGIW